MRKLIIAVVAPLLIVGCATTETRVAHDDRNDYQLAGDQRTETTYTTSSDTTSTDHPEQPFGSR